MIFISVDENGAGFVATYIPKSELAPLMTTIGNTFYIRSGSNNVPAPYSVLAGMFGRRPQAEIDLLITDKKLEVLENSEAVRKRLHFLCIKCPIVGVRYCETA